MAHQALGSFPEDSSPRPWPRLAPSLGLRGGLGKTLLVAFLLLAIVPLSLVSFLTYKQIQNDTAEKLCASLETIVALKEGHLMSWVESYERELSLLAYGSDLDSAASTDQSRTLAAHLAALQVADPTLKALILVDEGTGEMITAPDAARIALDTLPLELLAERRLLLAPAFAAGTSAPDPFLAVSYKGANRRLIGLLDWNSLQEIVTASDGQNAGITTWLVTMDGLMASSTGLGPLSAEGHKSPSEGVVRALQGRNGSGAYPGVEGVPVFGAYRWIPDLHMALLAEHPQTAALAAGNTLTAMVVGATLAVALLTAAIAAWVTRRLTRPIVQLTETAAWMARGNLNQCVTVTRRDEIGVLARAFNRMAAELRVLYGQLEAKVAERTQQLEEAHKRTRYYAMQLSISAEVARVASSIRNLDELLTTVVKLIGDAFELHHVSIYLLDSSGQWVIWQAGSDGLAPSEAEPVGGPTPVGQVASDGQCRVLRRCPAPPVVGDPSAAPLPASACEMAVPLHARRQVLGVLYLQSSKPDIFDGNDEMVYQSLADQVGIAIENARAYAMERETVRRLQELDRIQAQFLTNMSHALRTPLNSVIGFSRVMLKELDGPLTDLQRMDLTTIYKSGRQLLGLLNDMLELSQLEVGTASFSVEEVNLTEMVEGVMATARALALDKPVQLVEDLAANLPVLYTDGQRVRQVILALLSNAIKYTDEGGIRLGITADNGCVTIRVNQPGMGVSPLEGAVALTQTECEVSGEDSANSGFGLVISKRLVERLGGQIWVESKDGVGSTFTFTVPIRPAQPGLGVEGHDQEA
jgi:signal transduction histidine kinase